MDEDIRAGPLEDRLVHKNWKVRKAAYEDLEKCFKEATDETVLNKYVHFFKGIVADKNVAAQEQGLDAILVYIDRAENAPQINTLCPSIIDKCFGGRTKVKENACQIILLLIEVDKSGESVLTHLIKGASHRLAKIGALCITLIKDALKRFGSKVIPIKPIIQSLPKWFENTDKAIREESQALAIELYRWAGEAIRPQFANLRSAQIKDLNDAWAQLPKEKAVPERLLRCQQAAAEIEDSTKERREGGASESGEETTAEELDAFSLAAPVDVLSKLSDSWFTMLESKKWKERKEQLDSLIKLCDVPRLEPGNYSSLCKALKLIIDKDANVIVITAAVQACGLLARGLRSEFAAEAKVLLPSLLDKLKEKKATVVSAIHETLGNMIGFCFQISDVIEEIITALGNKVPQLKEQTLVFLALFLSKSKRPAVAQILKSLAPVLMGLLEDGSAEVREATYKAIGSLVGSVGDRPLAPYFAKLDKLKAAKVKEYFPEKIPQGPIPTKAASTTKTPRPAVAKNSAKTASPSNQALPPTRKASEGTTRKGPEIKKPPAGIATSRVPTRGASVLTTKEQEFEKMSKAKSSAPVRTVRKHDFPPGNSEEATEVDDALLGSATPVGSTRKDISAALTPELMQSLNHSDWRTRKQALDKIHDIIAKQGNMSIEPTGIDDLMLKLKARLSDGNKNLVVITLALLGTVAKAVGSPMEKYMKVLIPNMLTHFSDNKKTTRDVTAEAMDSWVEQIGLNSFLSYLAPIIAANNSISRKEALAWFVKHHQKLTSTPESQILIKPLLSCLQDRTPEVRRLAEVALQQVVLRTGFEAVAKFCRNMPPAIKLQIAPALKRVKQFAESNSVAPAVSTTSRQAGNPDSTASQKKDQPAQAPAPSKTPTKAVMAPSSVTSSPKKPVRATGSVGDKVVSVKKPPSTVPLLALVASSGKDARGNEDRQNRISFRDSPQSHESYVAAQAARCTSPHLYDKLFAKDSQKHREALVELSEFMGSHKQETLDNLDILLKWSAIRLCDNNTILHGKIIAFLQSLVQLLESQSQRLTDYEAAVLIPSLLVRCGHSEALCSSIRVVLKLIPRVYPASKLFDFLVLEGLQSSVVTPRARAESLYHMSLLIRSQGLNVCNKPASVLPLVVQLISDRSAILRNSAMVVLQQAFLHVGENIWKDLGSLTDSQKTQIKQRLGEAVQPPRSPGKEPTTPSKLLEESQPKLAPTNLSSFTTPSPPLRYQQSSKYEDRPTASAASLPIDAEPLSAVDARFQGITSTDPNVLAKTLKLLCTEIEQNATPFIASSDWLVSSLRVQLKKTLATDKLSLKLLKCILTALHFIFQRSVLALVVSHSVVKKLIKMLFLGLSDANSPASGEPINKWMNRIILDILQNGDCTSNFTALLQLLELALSNTKALSPKFTTLVLNSLQRMTSALKTTGLANLNIDQLLCDLHKLVETFPLTDEVEEEKSKTQKTVEALLNILVTLKGRDICNHLTLIPASQYPTPFIVRYLNTCVRVKYGGNELESDSPTSRESAYLAKAQLATVFKKIGVKETKQQGLEELAQFKQDHPEIDTSIYLRGTSDSFQGYLSRGLISVGKNKENDPKQENKALSSQSAMSYTEKLREIKRKYGLSQTTAAHDAMSTVKVANLEPQASDAQTRSSLRIDDLRARLGKVSSGVSSAQPTSATQSTEPPAQSESASLQALRMRLDIIKGNRGATA